MGAILSKRIDPVAYLNETVMEKIFDYLSDEDLKRCTLVSMRWERFIRNSSVCMRAFELKFHNFEWLSRSDFELLLNSQRKYSCISISNIEVLPRVRLLLGQFEWKSVKLCNLQFPSELDLIDFLGHFEPSVERFGMKNIKVPPLSMRLETNYLFPKARHIEIIQSSRFIYKKLFKACKDIKCLSLDLPCSKFEDDELVTIVDSIQSFMINNSKLLYLHLGISTVLFNAIFTERFVLETQFKLKALKFHRFRKTQQFRNLLALENTGVFLLNQSKTLEKIHLEAWLGFEVLHIMFNEMKKLKTVIIKDLHEYGLREDIQFLTLPTNPSIVYLDIQTFARYHEIFDLILGASPNLITLRMFALNQKVLNLLASNHQNLEYIYLDCITAETPVKDKAFKKLKFVCAYLYISKRFRETIEETPVWCRNNFEKKLISFLNEFKLYWS